MSLLGDEAQAIVDAGREVDGPSDEDRARIKRKLMARVGGGMAVAAIAAAGAASAPASAAAATSAAGAASAMSATSAAGAISTTSATGAAGTGAAATAAAVGSGGVLAKVGAIVALVGVLGGGAALGLREPAPPARLEANAAAIEETAAHAQKSAAAREVKEAEPTDSPALEVAAVPAPVSQQSARRPAVEPRKAGDDLGAELEALKKAQGALREGDGDRALSALDDAKGDALREERMAARVFALCQLGRVEEARAAAAQFLRDAPRSPLAGRVRAACAEGAPASAP